MLRCLLRATTCALAAAFLASASHAQTFDELIKTGRSKLDSNKADDAQKLFEKAVKLNPNSAEAHYLLGNATGSIAEKASIFRQPFLAKRVKSEFEKAVELDPNHVGGRQGLVQFYLRAPGVMGGSVEKAKEQAAAIAKLNPYRGHFVAADIANNQKDLAGVEREYRAAATEFPDSLNAVTALANFLSNNNRAVEAFPPIERYLVKHPTDRAAQYWFARTAAISGKDLDRGEQILRTLLAAPPLDTGPRILPESIHFRLGDIAAKRGDKVKARAEYQEALRLNPKHEGAKKALDALK